MRKWRNSDSSIYACALHLANAVLAIIPLYRASVGGDCALSVLVTLINQKLQRRGDAFQRATAMRATYYDAQWECKHSARCVFISFV